VSEPRTRLEFGPFRLDPVARVLWRGNTLLDVPPKAVELLAVLAAEAGEVVPKEHLLRRAWPGTFVEEANISVNVSILRRVLGNRDDGEAWIQTVPRRGYRFLGPVAQAAAPPRSLAVLPFRPLVGMTVDEPLGLGMADALISRLAATRRVVVRPTTAIRRFSAADLDAAEAGRQLKVDAVLDGRYQEAGSRLRVTAQLLPVDGSSPIWAERFDEERTDVLAVEDAIAERLAGALVTELSAEERQRLERRPTRSVAAWQAYSRGRLFWGRFSRPWVEKAMACFEEAAALDPAYAQPHAGLADCFLVVGLAGALPSRKAWSLAEGATAAACERDPELPEVQVSSAFLRLFGEWDWAGAERHLRRAVELAPLQALGHQWHGLLLALSSRSAEAEAALVRAAELDPLSVTVSALQGLARAFAGDHEGELAQQRRTLELDAGPFLGHWAVGGALHNLGRFEEAVGEIRQALALGDSPAFLRPVLARCLAGAGKADEARAVLAESAGQGSGLACLRATVHLTLGERARALDLLQQACDERDPWIVTLAVDPSLRSLRGNAAFESLVERVRPAPRGAAPPGARR
jgi:DNA-binding winged helix-turn-helix (wHTH) protein/tetratricopeptide (TPR) repeat protein